jgi:AcrR family transcriptional regulator
MNIMRNGTEKEPRRRRGRPRQFDADAVLDRALALFWERGLAAPTLDELAGAMGLNRPSLANAFGGKEAVYRRALARFAAAAAGRMAAVLDAEPDLARALTRFYEAALEVYGAGGHGRGCFVMCTAPAAALAHPEVRADLGRVIDEIDGVLARRFARARDDGQLARDRDPKAAAQLAQAVLHTLAIRARAGASRTALRALARRAVALLAS